MYYKKLTEQMESKKSDTLKAEVKEETIQIA